MAIFRDVQKIGWEWITPQIKVLRLLPKGSEISDYTLDYAWEYRQVPHFGTSLRPPLGPEGLKLPKHSQETPQRAQARKWGKMA